MPKRNGFTLIEMLVVLAIVALLLTVVTPRMLGQLDSAKDKVLQENLHQTREVLDKFYGDKGRYPQSLDELVEKGYLRAVPMDPITESTSTWAIENPPVGYKGTVGNVRSGAPGAARDGSLYRDW